MAVNISRSSSHPTDFSPSVGLDFNWTESNIGLIENSCLTVRKLARGSCLVKHSKHECEKQPLKSTSGPCWLLS